MKLFLILLLFVSSYGFAKPIQTKGKPKQKKERFVFKPEEFIKPGLTFRFDNGLGYQNGTTGKQHIVNEFYIIPKIYGLNYPYLLSKDTISMDNIENFSAISQDKSYRVVPNRLSFTYTHPKIMQFSLEGSVRSVFYKGDYTLYNIPGYPGVSNFSMYFGTKKYSWNDSQINLVWNEGINRWLMVSPLVGYRKETRDYSKSIDPFFYSDDSAKFYRYKEFSTNYSHQSGIRFHFKVSENFRINLTTKAFFSHKGELLIEKDLVDGFSNSAYTYYKQKARMVHEGNEHELEAYYILKTFKFYVGTNYTVYHYRIKDGAPPLILNWDSNKLLNSYLDYFFRDAIYDSDRTEKGQGGFGKGRAQYLKYFYFGVSFSI